MAADPKLVKIFEYALNQEHTGKNFFANALGSMGVGAAVSALEKLIQEEEKHILFIGKILEDLKAEGALSLSSVEGIILEPTNYFDKRADSEFLELCVQDSMVPDVTIFNTAYLIERDLSEFYNTMAQKVSGDAKEALKMLSDWEKAHERFFKRYRDKLTETYWQMPWGG